MINKPNSKLLPNGLKYSIIACCYYCWPITVLANQQLNDVTLLFSGRLINTGCEITIKSANQTVNLGTISTSTFTGPGSTSPLVPFNIELTKCVGVNTVNVTMKGDEGHEGNTYKIIQQDNAATGVAIQISTTLARLQIPEESLSWAFSEQATDITLGYLANYVQTQDRVTPGKAHARVSVTIEYK